MLLQPRKYIYKTRQKQRSSLKFRWTSLVYGTGGFKILAPIKLTSKQLFNLYIFLKKSSKRAEITKRAFWVNVFPHLPLTRKPKGMRMGKGLGKLSMWFTTLTPGIVLVEFKHLRVGRLAYFVTQLKHKFNTPFLKLIVSSKFIKLQKLKKLNVISTPFLN